MAKVRKKVRSKKTEASPFKNYWENHNYIILGLGLFVLVIGFLLMLQGPWDNPISLTLSPIVLLIAYIIIFPLSIFYKRKKKTNKDIE